MPNHWTFRMKPIKRFIEKELWKAKTVLIPFAGEVRYQQHPNIIYIDIEPGLPLPYTQGDSFQVLPQFVQEQKKFDLILSDPPYTSFQAIHTYHNEQLQDITFLKECYDKLLVPNGVIIHFGFNSSGMGKSRYYKKEELLVVNLGGSHNDIIVLKERKTQTTLV